MTAPLLTDKISAPTIAPDSQPQQPVIQFWVSIALVASVLAGAGAGLLIFLILPIVPNDLERTRTILMALRSPRPELHTVIFGDSVIMNGVDAGELSTERNAAMNLSSSGQTLAESALYYQELPPSVTTVVQSVRLSTLVCPQSREAALKPQAANAFRVYGYKPTPDTLQLLNVLAPAESLTPLKENVLRCAIRARWILRQWLDISARQLLRPDMDMDRAACDLLFPSPFTRPMEPAKLKVKFNWLRRQHEHGRCTLGVNAAQSIAAARKHCERAGRRFILLVAPVHPELDDLYEPSARNELKQAIQSGRFGPPGTVIDATQLLNAGDFYDEEHPGADGAHKLTRFIKQVVNES
ncbi:MAG: hypothetical protein HY401_10220 [Elusimicrobia bacterium]|nr:hypothetical protein [Elusimicrobiota bacterium]